MSEFTSKINYAEQHDVYFNDGRELDLLMNIFYLPPEILARLRNNPAAILAAIDEFATQKYLMNIGELKGKLITDLISQTKPTTMVELGGYVGYSTILFASHLRAISATPTPRYYCLELNPVFGAVIMALVDLAGLTEVVTVVIGPSDVSLKRLHAEGVLAKVDMLFLDHYKPAYVRDLKLCESLGLVAAGSVLVADNVVKPGNPPYLEYVRASVEKKKEALEKGVSLGDEAMGDPLLRYKSKMVESFEPTGIPDAIEITVCEGH